MYLDGILSLISRMVHVISAVVLLGGVIYAWMVEEGMSEEAAKRFRSWVIPASALLALSGIYNVFRKTNPPQPYSIVLGIKVLLALHVFAVAIVATKPGVSPDKRVRQLKSVAISGTAVVLLASYLRWLSG
jgi:putative copper export protein